MLPVLFRIGPLTIRAYGLMLALGFSLALALAAARGRKRGLSADTVLDFGFYLILAGVLGSRLFYVLQFPSYYLDHPLAVLKIWEGGLVFYGGLIGALVVGGIYLRSKHLRFLFMADLMAPSIALGQATGRIGCFAAGCCYGAPFAGPWAVTFSDPACLAPLKTPLHPTQLYLSAADFSNVLLLLFIDRRRKFEGQTFLSYLFIYSASRLILEFFRGDDRGSFLGSGLSPAQGIGLILLVAALAGWLWLRRKGRMPTT